jgi:dTDP-4-amino-4,6-dideoxygalactose transaminase
MQAAVLRTRLTMLPEWTARRRALAQEYRAKLAGAAVTILPECDPGHVYHLFPVLTPRRDAFQAHLAERGVGTLVHYPIPIPRQPALAAVASAPCPIADRVTAEVCSLPFHQFLTSEDVDAIADAVHAWRG